MYRSYFCHVPFGQVTELEIEQVCKSYTWLKDIHLFASQWNPASLESLKGQPASVYEEHIKKLHHWAQRIHTVCPSTCISSNLIVIDSTHIKENLCTWIQRKPKASFSRTPFVHSTISATEHCILIVWD